MFIAIAANRSRRPSGARCSEMTREIPEGRLSLGAIQRDTDRRFIYIAGFIFYVPAFTPVLAAIEITLSLGNV
jgi:hypothetical protein